MTGTQSGRGRPAGPHDESASARDTPTLPSQIRHRIGDGLQNLFAPVPSSSLDARLSDLLHALDTGQSQPAQPPETPAAREPERPED